MAVVYRHIRLDTFIPFYIGIGKEESRAFYKHKRSSLWNNIVNKYGYLVEIVANGISYEDAKELERILIFEYGRLDNNTGILTNHTDGGQGSLGLVFSEETKKKIGSYHKGKIISYESRMKMSESRKGTKYSDSMKNKISELKKGNKYNLGKKHTEETKLKISKSQKGKIVSEETKLKMSLAQKGIANRLGEGKKVRCLKTNLIYNTLSDCAEKNNIGITTLCKYLNGYLKNKTSFIYEK